MKFTLRAALAVALLLGVYVVGLAIVVGLALAVYELAVHGVTGFVVGKLGLVAVFVLFAVGRGLFSRKKTQQDPPGLPLTESRQPGLWQQVRRIADAVGIRAPDEIRLVPESTRPWRSRAVGSASSPGFGACTSACPC